MLNSALYWRTEVELPRAARLDPRRVLPALDALTGGRALIHSQAADRIDPASALWGRICQLAQRLEWTFGVGGQATLLLGDSRERVALSNVTQDSFVGQVLERTLLPDMLPTAEIDAFTVGVLVALAWCLDGPRAQMSHTWERLHVSSDASGAAEDQRRRGHLRVTLHDGKARAGRPGPEAFPVQVELLRQAKRGGRMLKPSRFDCDLDALRAELVEPTAGELNLCRQMSHRALTARLVAPALNPGPADTRRHLAAEDEAFAATLGATELVFEGAPIEPHEAPWCPTLIVEDAVEHDGLDLRWDAAPVAWWPYGAGWVLDANRRLWPVPEAFREAAPRWVSEALPVVYGDEIPGFIRGFLGLAPVRVRLEHTRRVHLSMGHPQARVVVTAAGDGARIDVGFEYAGVCLAPGDPRPVVLNATQMVQRDPMAESALRGTLRRVLGAEPGGVLPADAVLDFLLDGVPGLDGWTVELDRDLHPGLRRPRGQLRAESRFESGVDWFALDVNFTLDDAQISLRDALAAWRRGRRYVSLPSGGAARLPIEYLRRHAAALSDLLAAQASTDGQLGAAFTPLLNELAPQPESPWSTLGSRIETFEGIGEEPAPEGLNATLRGYQLEGYRWLRTMSAMGLGVLLADDMGLGKTVQCIALLISRPGPALVVAPTSVIHNWRTELQRFAPDLTVALHHGPRRGDVPENVDVVITSYPLLRRDLQQLGARVWSTVVFDEAQSLKNPSAAVTRAAGVLRAQARIALTGTPVENHLLELWSLFQILNPGLLGSQARFRDLYAAPIEGPDGQRMLARLRARLRPFMLRRLKAEVATELPARQIKVIACPLGPAQRAVYDATRDAYRAGVLEQVAGGHSSGGLGVLEALTRLRQACCHPDLVPLSIARGTHESAKLDRLLEILEIAVEEGHRCLIFSQWPSFLQLARRALDDRGITSLYLDGQTKHRASLQAQWNAPDGPPAFLISIKAGGTGLNLVGADHVFHLDPWWNPAVEAQATDRAHRIGQTRPVMVYKLVAKDTVEEQILALQDRKRALFEATINAERAPAAALDADTLRAVFGG